MGTIFAVPSTALKLLMLLGIAGCASAIAEDPTLDPSLDLMVDPKLDESRSLVQAFGSQLKGELKKSLQEGGPVRAVRVCRDVAPQIASQLSRQSGAKVMRTSLRYRNSANAPEPWQTRVLQRFDEQALKADTALPLEHFARGPDGGARYMLAIRTDGVCLACHGESLPAPLLEGLNADYPHDRAVGYKLGDVRGAFSVTWPPPDQRSRK
ncbi:MAG: Tll0287-like domain-containing protein [Woeseiaceae bacterium]